MKSDSPSYQVWGKRIDASPDQLNIEFCAGRDVKSIPMADERLIIYDLWTNLAHVKMLNKVGIISLEECRQLTNGLLVIKEKAANNTFQLDPAKEDVHINIEHYLTQQLEIHAARKMHTGRSRNDQVASDMRLFLRDQVFNLSNEIEKLVQAILKKSIDELDTLMPGFTHYQPAMITTAAHWMTSWSQGLLRDLESLLANLKLLNRSPLGAAAAFGTSWPIDREFTAKLMGFDAVESNTLDCIISRGENEARIAFVISTMMNHLSTIAQDLILLSTPFYNMVGIDKRFVTGSSIMPQKQNPDFAEVMRGKAAHCHGLLSSLLGVQKGAMSGYNRDSQTTKYTIMELFDEILHAPTLLGSVIETLTFKKDQMLKNCKIGFINAADVADWLAQKSNMSFRECYDLLSLSVKYSEKSGQLTFEAINTAKQELNLDLEISVEDVTFLNQPENMITAKTHTGGPSPEAVKSIIDNQHQSLKNLMTEIRNTEKQVNEAMQLCFTT